MLIPIGKFSGAFIFCVAAITAGDAIASSYLDMDADAHNVRVPVQFNPVLGASGTVTMSMSFGPVVLTSIPGALPASHSFFVDGVMFDATMEAEHRLMPYQSSLAHQPRPSDSSPLFLYSSPPSSGTMTASFKLEPPVKPNDS